MDRKPLVIKKYENRRLYDTTNSRYVNLEEVAQAVQDGVDVQVVDAATGEDITRFVLTQIIMDNAKGPNSAFPLDVLRQMVMASGHASQEGALKYMKAMFEMYQNAYRAFSPPVSPFDFVRNMAAAGSASPATPAPPVSPPQPPSLPPASTPEVQEPASSLADTREQNQARDLQRRVQELENMVAKLGKEKVVSKRKKSARRK